MAQPQNYVDKVAKLLAKAESSGVTHDEREALLAAASRIMVKRGIDAAMLAAHDPERAAGDLIGKTFADVTGVGPIRYGKEWVTLGIAVATGMGARAFYHTPRGSKRIRLLVVAHQSDAERIVQLWRSLQVQATSELARFVAGFPTWNAYDESDKYQMRRSFIIGYGRQVGSRLRALRAETVAEASITEPGTDVALRDRESQIDAWMTKEMGKIGKARDRQYDQVGDLAGRVAGSRADIGQTTLDTGMRRLGAA